MEGAIGLPVFAGGTFGAAVLVGPTGGYLFGFVASAYIVGLFCEKGWDRNWKTVLPVFTLGTAIIFAFGLTWLSKFVGWSESNGLGLVPFLPGAVVKLVIAAATFKAGWGWTKKFRKISLNTELAF